MGKTIGFDFRTYKLLRSRYGSGEPVVIPNPEGRAHHTIGCCILQDR